MVDNAKSFRLNTDRNNGNESSEKPFLSRANEWIDTGELFPEATSAIRHYGDSMPEYPSGFILLLKRMIDLGLIIWGRNYDFMF
ncbi:hypothetical protein SDC9_110636 [bioreactor metagenome]|uniref:Uncharacterized protein n=1 Tax=bioreactor metagenome TaxID=1076179 RepID=A0A645BKK9_9ZZZZ|nr:MAG: hypothetical protein BGO33_10735 [Bacteroidia bacterium 43-41]